MINKPIYTPSGKAAEYGDYAINIYTGCPHGCDYCFAPLVLHKHRTDFHAAVEPRHDIVDSVRLQLLREGITGKQIHLCFSCDPYPRGCDTMPTREIISALKASGNNVQILTKAGQTAMRDFDLLGASDWFGVTIACGEKLRVEREPYAAPIAERMVALKEAHSRGIRTWASLEPVLDAKTVKNAVKRLDYVDLFRIGKLNYAVSDIDWASFGYEIEDLCRKYKRNYYIKLSLREEMDERAI
jgi:DNA repair photolyase